MSKGAQYKETSVFEIFPKFEYTRFQRSRVVLFHAYAANYRKIIRYASNFDVPNKICLIYLVGGVKPESIAKELQNSGCSDRICVLTSPFPKDGLLLYKQFDEMRRQAINSGMWNKDTDDFTPMWYEEYKKEKTIGLKINRELYTELVSERDEKLELLHQYRRLKKRAKNTYFKKFICYRIGKLPKPFFADSLDKLIVRIFPYGVEASGINHYAGLSPASVEPVVNAIYADTWEKKFGFELDKNNPTVRAACRFINKQLELVGYCDLDKLSELLRSPPYGLSWNGYSAACIVYALKQYENRIMLYYDGVCTFKVKDSYYGIVRYMLDPTFRRRQFDSCHCLYIECLQHKVVKRFINKLYGVKMMVPGWMMGMHARCVIESSIRLPLSATDYHLYLLTSLELMWHDREQITELAQYIQSNESILLEQFHNHLLMDRQLSADERKRYAEASGWLWHCDLTKEG